MRQAKNPLRAGYLFVALICVGNAGCLAAALGAAGVAGGATGYAYYKGQICQAFPAACDDVGLATRSALADLAMPILQENHTTGWLESRTGDGTGVHIHIKTLTSKVPADGILTRVCVRVAFFGDHDLSYRILNQIGMHLRPAVATEPPTAAPVPGAVPGPVPTPVPRVEPVPVPVPASAPASGPAPASLSQPVLSR
jgi:Protein of unknown function (DUF3568)